MTDIGTLRNEDHVLGDVLGVIADALHRLRRPHRVDGGGDRTRVFHHEGHQLAQDGAKALVQTGIVAEIFQKMGMQTVNMPGGEIIPAAQRGVIDCAEWVGGVEDLRLGLPQVFKYHYTPGMHEPSVVGELTINGDVWKGLSAQQQEAIRTAAMEVFIRWWVKWQKQNADAMEEMRVKHGTQILRTPPDILIAFLKAWDEIAREESEKNPFFKRVLDSQRAYASKVVPAKRFLFPPYSFAANYYWPEQKSAAKGEGRKK